LQLESVVEIAVVVALVESRQHLQLLAVNLVAVAAVIAGSVVAELAAELPSLPEPRWQLCYLE
jgi:hypothetical protein